MPALIYNPESIFLIYGIGKSAGLFNFIKHLGFPGPITISPYLGFHTLRPLMASILADDPAVSIKTIQTALGHSEARTTEIYLHSIDGAVENAMDSISGKFSPEVQE